VISTRVSSIIQNQTRAFTGIAVCTCRSSAGWGGDGGGSGGSGGKVNIEIN
jgi:hypothetical protein